MIRLSRPPLTFGIPKRWFSNSSHCFEIFKVAIVGAGPAGFYTAHHILSKSSPSTKFQIDFFERLPAPYGLSRYGVAPDHPEVKNCEDYLDNIMKDFGNSQGGSSARFFGNVEVGKDISLENLGSCYHSIVLSYGCTASDNKLSIPGADLKGIISAREFVQWYNGHPDFYENKLSPPKLLEIKNVTIIGNGNVAMDVARVLLGGPDHWKPTDITQDTVESLKTSSIEKVNIVARRGILQSAFTNKEIRELLELSKERNIQFNIDLKLVDDIDIKSLGRVDKRKVSLLKKYSDLTPVDNPKQSWNLQYLKGPIQLIPKSDDRTRVEKLEVSINALHTDELTGEVSIKPTGETEIIENDLVILSIGYLGTPLSGFEKLGIQFKQNKLSNVRGRILSNDSGDIPKYKHGWYTSGWIKNGPQGVIATTMMDSFDTADIILEDINNGVYNTPKSDIDNYIKNYISWEKWSKLNEYELKSGEETGKLRLKVHNFEKMLEIECSH